MATQWKAPAVVGVTDGELATGGVALLRSPLTLKSGGPVQVVSVAGKSAKVTVPVGLAAPDGPRTVAASEMAVPSGPPAEAVVVTVGLAAVMVTGSAPVPVHGELTGPL